VRRIGERCQSPQWVTRPWNGPGAASHTGNSGPSAAAALRLLQVSVFVPSGRDFGHHDRRDVHEHDIGARGRRVCRPQTGDRLHIARKNGFIDECVVASAGVFECALEVEKWKGTNTASLSSRTPGVRSPVST
jgi:hypothetical protein